MTDTDIDELGPIDYLIVEFPADRKPDGSALPYLVDLVEKGIIRVLDLMFIRREQDGSITGLDIADVDMDGELDITLFAERNKVIEESARDLGPQVAPHMQVRLQSARFRL